MSVLRDLSLILILLLLIRLTLYRPWLGVLALAFLAYMHPQSFVDPPVADLPIFLIMTLTVMLAAILSPQSQVPPWDWRLPVFGLLWLLFLISTVNSVMPWYAWPRFFELSKIFLPLALTWWLIDTREKLFCLLAIISVSVLMVSFKGGYWAIMNGFSDRVYGPSGSQYYDNNHFAILMVMNLPLLAIWLREVSYRPLKILIMGGVGVSIAAILSSWSRGAILMLVPTVLLMILGAKHKLPMLLLLFAALLFGAAQVPDKWYQRMDTIENYEQDKSAIDRLQSWQVGLNYIARRPVLGGGFWARFAILDTDYNGVMGDSADLRSNLGWHSAYITMATEHGLPALFLWLLLLVGSIVSLARMAWAYRRAGTMGWVADYSMMLMASLIAYAIGSAFLALPYLDIWFHLVIVSVVLKSISRVDVDSRRSVVNEKAKLG